MKVTLKDVARDCRVSIGTVSDILHEKGNFKEETRQRVMDAVRRLKYRGAENLHGAAKKNRTTLGLVVPAPAAEKDTFFSRAVSAAKGAASRAGYDFILLSEDEVVAALDEYDDDAGRSMPYDGIICFCPLGDYDGYLGRLKDADVPAVLIRRETTVPGVPVITDDDRAGAMLAVEHLHGLGHTRIGMIRRTTGADLKGRLAGYREAVEKLGLVDDAVLVQDVHHHTRETFDRVMDGMLGKPDRPTAFVCESDDLAIGMVRCLAQRNLRVPDDVAVVGYDDDLMAEKFYPSITTVRIPVNEMVRMACDLLAFRLGGGWRTEYDIVESSQHFTLASKLIVRESCGASEGKSNRGGLI